LSYIAATAEHDYFRYDRHIHNAELTMSEPYRRNTTMAKTSSRSLAEQQLSVRAQPLAQMLLIPFSIEERRCDNSGMEIG